jgi:DNA-binding response OmpR family regulator
MHALIIHDEALFEPIEEILGGIGFTSFELASSFEDGVTAARRRHPDVIVTAYRLGNRTAREPITTICKHRESPVVFVTIETDAVLNWLRSAIIVTRPIERLALEIAVEDAVVHPFGRQRARRSLGGPTALLYS